jgi:hypothetical protein
VDSVGASYVAHVVSVLEHGPPMAPAAPPMSGAVLPAAGVSATWSRWSQVSSSERGRAQSASVGEASACALQEVHETPFAGLRDLCRSVGGGIAVSLGGRGVRSPNRIIGERDRLADSYSSVSPQRVTPSQRN